MKKDSDDKVVSLFKNDVDDVKLSNRDILGFLRTIQLLQNYSYDGVITVDVCDEGVSFILQHTQEPVDVDDEGCVNSIHKYQQIVESAIHLPSMDNDVDHQQEIIETIKLAIETLNPSK